MSDLLTPFDLIERRIEGASMGDMVVVLYNPSSKKRADYLQKACDIMLKYKTTTITIAVKSKHPPLTRQTTFAVET